MTRAYRTSVLVDPQIGAGYGVAPSGHRDSQPVTFQANVTGIVLAGGMGVRAGGPKADLTLGDDGVTMLEAAVARFRGWFGTVVVSVRDAGQAAPEGCVAVADEPAGCGPLAGVATALERCETDLAFVAACDMPELDPDTIAHLLEVAVQAPSADVVIPADAASGRLHPLHAVYRASAAAKLRAALDGGERSMHRALQSCEVVTVPVADLPAPGSVANLNTAAELDAYRERA